MDTEERLRTEAVRRVLAGEPVPAVARALQRSERWVFKWTQRYDPSDARWAQGHSRAPRHVANRSDPKLEALVLSVRARLARQPWAQIGAPAIAWELHKLHLRAIPELRTIERILERASVPRREYRLIRFLEVWDRILCEGPEVQGMLACDVRRFSARLELIECVLTDRFELAEPRFAVRLVALDLHEVLVRERDEQPEGLIGIDLARRADLARRLNAEGPGERPEHHAPPGVPLGVPKVVPKTVGGGPRGSSGRATPVPARDPDHDVNVTRIMRARRRPQLSHRREDLRARVHHPRRSHRRSAEHDCGPCRDVIIAWTRAGCPGATVPGRTSA